MAVPRRDCGLYSHIVGLRLSAVLAHNLRTMRAPYPAVTIPLALTAAATGENT